MSTHEQFVTASLNGDAVAASTAFNDLMRSKLSAQIDNLRQTTAATLAAGPEVTDGEAGSIESN